MNDIDKIDAILRHIHAVQDNCRLLGERLIEKGEVALGIQLIANSMCHDQSKMEGIEYDHLHPTNPDKDALAMAISHHNRTNKHHPEFWGGIKKVPRVYLGEMLADWKVRASEFGTSLLEWINGGAAKRYDFSQQDKVYEDIMYFYKLLCDQPFQAIRPEGQH